MLKEIQEKIELTHGSELFAMGVYVTFEGERMKVSSITSEEVCFESGLCVELYSLDKETLELINNKI